MKPQTVADGVAVIRDFVRTLPDAPGVYRMLDAAGEPLYVGKARSLKRRVNNYTQTAKLPIRLQRMVRETRAMEFVRTHTEVEALLLESNLIKRLKPRFNINLRDDKSFPFIELTQDHEFPRISKHRGSRQSERAYFGPFASAGAVDRTIQALARSFMVRTCADTIFSTRSRPCLQHQIKRCTAPCVGLVTKEQYEEQVRLVRDFLAGRTREVQAKFATEMQAASERLEFEVAAGWRDRIRALSAVQANQDVNTEEVDDADVIAACAEGGETCVQVFFFRGGRNYGNRAYFPTGTQDSPVESTLSAFVAQFYEGQPPPRQVLLSHKLEEQDLLAEALTLKAGQRVELSTPQRGDKKRLVGHAEANAREALQRKRAEGATQAKLLDGVAELFGLSAAPERIEVYDNSHIMGTNAVGGMIVAGPTGFLKNSYRKFNIKGPIAPGDDYAMMREVLTRRFGRAQREDPERTEGSWPDLVLIDGGQGQLAAAMEVMGELGVHDVPLVGIAKGPDRDAGRERFFMAGREPFQLPPNDPVLFYLQRLRDEVHRFAIGTHRARRQKSMERSPLDEVQGIGPGRKKALLHHFGSARAVARAGLADLEAVPGISSSTAKKVYDHFHGGT
ncbi:excinuclease ABC subunit UvrC [Roseiterribacter gracilis]|uniref:UvrABC system protein C n=1 Tax=Roseiterribacter gracilis TaxID=2812848 RepID=A0A8S8XCY2_9PROT|nr:UvrABC system protein C [Rhodospirillales bacterium TMPK1]